MPGNVEVKGGAAVATREYDEATEQTTFELLPPRGPLAIVLSLNPIDTNALRIPEHL